MCSEPTPPLLVMMVATVPAPSSKNSVDVCSGITSTSHAP